MALILFYCGTILQNKNKVLKIMTIEDASKQN